MKTITLLGATLAILALPHVVYTAIALFELWGERPPEANEIMLLHYEVYGVYRWAFVAAHAWLVWTAIAWRQASVPRHVCVLAVMVAVELGVVYCIVGFLRARGFPIDYVALPWT